MSFFRPIALSAILMLPFWTGGAFAQAVRQETEVTEPKVSREFGDEASKDRSGQLMEREEGGYALLDIENHRFRVTFFDEEKEPIDPPYAFATLRYNGPRHDKEFIRLRLREGENYLWAPRYVDKPYNFWVWLFFFEEGVEGAQEKYSFHFRK